MPDLEDELEEAPRQAAGKPDAQEFGDFIEDDLGGGAEGGAGVQPGRRRRRMTGMPTGVSAAAMRVRTGWCQELPGPLHTCAHLAKGAHLGRCPGSRNYDSPNQRGNISFAGGLTRVG